MWIWRLSKSKEVCFLCSCKNLQICTCFCFFSVIAINFRFNPLGSLWMINLILRLLEYPILHELEERFGIARTTAGNVLEWMCKGTLNYQQKFLGSVRTGSYSNLNTGFEPG